MATQPEQISQDTGIQRTPLSEGGVLDGSGRIIHFPTRPTEPKRFSRRWLLGAGVAGLGFVIAQQIPEVRQLEQDTLDGIRLQIDSWWEHIRPQSIEDRFPNKLEAANFSSKSTEIPRNQIVDFQNNKGFIGFPADQEAVRNSPNLRTNTYLDVTLLPAYVNIKELQNKNVKNIWQITGFPKGTVIYAPVNGSAVAISEADKKTKDGPTPAYTSWSIMFRDEDGRACGITLSALWAEPLISIKPYPQNVSPTPETGTPIGLFQPILRLTKDLQDWDGTGQAFPNERGQIAMRLSYDQREPRAPIPFTVDFLQSNGVIYLNSGTHQK